MIAVFRSRSLTSQSEAAEVVGNFGDLDAWIDSGMGQDPEDSDLRTETDSNGFASMSFKFRSSASDRHPQVRVFPSQCWILIRSKSHGSVLTTLGVDAVDYVEVRERGGFLIPIGLSSRISTR